MTAAAITGQIDRLESRTGGDDLFPGRSRFRSTPTRRLRRSPSRRPATATTTSRGRALDGLRDDIVPATLGQVGGAEVSVTGPAAQTRDFNESMVEHLPYVLRVRVARGVRAAARDLQVDRDPDRGDRPEPALRGRRLTACWSPCSRTSGRRACSASDCDRGDRALAAAVPVRDPVRAVDGLPVFILTRVREAYDRGHEHRGSRRCTESGRRPGS